MYFGKHIIIIMLYMSPASASVPDEALERACYVLRFLLADREDMREQFYRHYGRVVVMGADQLLHQVSRNRYTHRPTV